MSLELNKYLLDVVYHREDGCQLVTYVVAAHSAAAAYERWANEDTTEFPIAYEGEVVPAIIVGVAQQ